LAPVTSFLPEDCTCRIARWITRWKPSVGWVSISSVPGDARGVFFDEFDQLTRSSSMLAAQALQHLGGGRVVQQRQQQMLHGDELVALLPCLDEGHVQADFKFLRDHSILLHHACQRMLMLDEQTPVTKCSTLVVAMSRGKTPHTPTPSSMHFGA
jgi:hypothetical protein